jgi:transcriptional regulator with XRE-family HTH domain
MTTLLPVDSREVVRCDHCLLVQFRTSNDFCRRCHASFDDEDLEVVMAPPPPEMMALDLASSVRYLRERNSMSRQQLAERMSVPRSYVWKIESGRVKPSISGIERLAAALEVPVPDLLPYGLARSFQREREIERLVEDEFIAELIPYLSRLGKMQLSAVLATVRDMKLQTLM